jgi:integral membrane sensor domain MASE1
MTHPPGPKRSIGQLLAFLGAVAVISAPQAALACPVCFGALEGPVADGTNKAVLTLLGVTVGVLAAFATFFVYLVRRARAMPLGAEYAPEVAGRRNIRPPNARPHDDAAEGDVEDIMEGAA